MKQLPESIRRGAKRLLRLAKQNHGSLLVTNLSQAQEVVSQIHGARGTFDALEQKPCPPIDKTALALAIGEATCSTGFRVWRDELEDNDGEANSQMVLVIATDDMTTFDTKEILVGGEWDPADDNHMGRRYEIAINLRRCSYFPYLAKVHAYAVRMFEYLAESGGDYVFGALGNETPSKHLPEIYGLAGGSINRMAMAEAWEAQANRLIAVLRAIHPSASTDQLSKLGSLDSMIASENTEALPAEAGEALKQYLDDLPGLRDGALDVAQKQHYLLLVQVEDICTRKRGDPKRCIAAH